MVLFSCRTTTKKAKKMNDQSDNDDEGYSTPRESPLKPRALSKSTSKKIRRVDDLRERVNEMKGCDLNNGYSFHVPIWTLDNEDRISTTNEPMVNVKIMLRRSLKVEALLKESFRKVSNPYFGKTSDFNSRFNKHQLVKAKIHHSLIMVSIGCFKSYEIQKQDLDRYRIDIDMLGLLYEKMLIEEALNTGMRLMDDNVECGGGGRGGVARHRQDKTTVHIYCLFSVS
jgi:hypothetical protein